MTTYLDIHVLQTLPPSNVNRDDTGAPKTALYGGVRRARVSSQAWKRATRVKFAEDLDPTALAYRTTRILDLVVAEMGVQRPGADPSEVIARATEVLNVAGAKLKPKKGKDNGNGDLERSPYLWFLSAAQVTALAGLAWTHEGGKPPKNDVLKAIGANHGIEVSLFGRMVADDKDLNVDASVQVAHALSTHAVEPEQDYYTAVDDKNVDDAGAGMIGTIEFNSSTIYRFATVSLDGLRKNLGDNAATLEALELFTRSFVLSMPTGKQNTFANRTLPDAVILTVRTDQPVSFVGAFEDAVRSRSGFVTASAERLANYATAGMDFVDPAELTIVVRHNDGTAALDVLGDRMSLAAALGQIRGVAETALPQGDS